MSQKTAEPKTDPVISISSDDSSGSVIYMGTCLSPNKTTEMEQPDDSSYFADDSAETESSWSFETPPDLLEKLKLLYSGAKLVFVDEAERDMTSTPMKKKDFEDNQHNKET